MQRSLARHLSRSVARQMWGGHSARPPMSRVLTKASPAANRTLQKEQRPLQAPQPRHLAASSGPDAGSETHGGDDIYKVKRLVCDFSVTTNALGPVPSALEAVQEQMANVEHVSISPRGGEVSAMLQEMQDDDSHASASLATSPAVEHYPERIDAELEDLTAAFLAGEKGAADARPRLIFGNGASELIDLVARLAPEGDYCISPHVKVQYREYQRACTNAGRQLVTDPKEASIICLVNPNNPTGDFLERAEMEAWIEENSNPGSWVVVDESMLFWAGPDFRERGVSPEFVKKMAKKHISIFLVQSWTKIFSCTGLRIGTVLCPSSEKRDFLVSKQVPWSVNCFARTYLKAALQDTQYLERTWDLTSRWREHTVTQLQRLHPEWEFHGKPWTSWIWVDTGSEEAANSVYQTALEAGCPVRHAGSGYGLPTFVRFAVRRPYDFSVLYQALLQRQVAAKSAGGSGISFGTYADVHPNVVDGVRLVHIDDLKRHENVLQDRKGMLTDYMNALPIKVLPAIIIDSQFQVVLDGHHRLELFRQAGMQIVPCVAVNYFHEDIMVNPPWVNATTQKEDVVRAATRDKLLEPKSTQHMVKSRGGTLMPLIVLAPQIAEIRR